MKIDRNSNLPRDDRPGLGQISPEERFELLSAYMDGEVTARERQQVQQWLDTDPEFHKLYTQMLGLSRGMKTLPIPQTEQSTQALSKGVFQRLDRDRSIRRIFIVTGGAFAALFVGTISGMLSGNNSFVPQMATNQLQEQEPLMIAINEPVVLLPQAESEQ